MRVCSVVSWGNLFTLRQKGKRGVTLHPNDPGSHIGERDWGKGFCFASTVWKWIRNPLNEARLFFKSIRKFVRDADVERE